MPEILCFNVDTGECFMATLQAAEMLIKRLTLETGIQHEIWACMHEINGVETPVIEIITLL